MVYIFKLFKLAPTVALEVKPFPFKPPLFIVLPSTLFRDSPLVVFNDLKLSKLAEYDDFYVIFFLPLPYRKVYMRDIIEASLFIYLNYSCGFFLLAIFYRPLIIYVCFAGDSSDMFTL